MSPNWLHLRSLEPLLLTRGPRRASPFACHARAQRSGAETNGHTVCAMLIASHSRLNI